MPRIGRPPRRGYSPWGARLYSEAKDAHYALRGAFYEFRYLWKRGKSKDKKDPNAAGVDVGAESHYVAVPGGRDPEGGDVGAFWVFTADLYALAGWLTRCGITTVAVESNPRELAALRYHRRKSRASLSTDRGRQRPRCSAGKGGRP